MDQLNKVKELCTMAYDVYELPQYGGLSRQCLVVVKAEHHTIRDIQHYVFPVVVTMQAQMVASGGFMEAAARAIENQYLIHKRQITDDK